MLMKSKQLDKNKYYHCRAVNNYKNTWLSKGDRGYIFLENSLSTKPYFCGDPGGLDSVIDWEVREASVDERAWIIQCIYERRLVPKPMDGIPYPEPVYQIF